MYFITGPNHSPNSNGEQIRQLLLWHVSEQQEGNGTTRLVQKSHGTSYFIRMRSWSTNQNR